MYKGKTSRILFSSTWKFGGCHSQLRYIRPEKSRTFDKLIHAVSVFLRDVNRSNPRRIANHEVKAPREERSEEVLNEACPDSIDVLFLFLSLLAESSRGA